MASTNPPLDGIRVLDLGRHQAGPRCAQVLSRLGAEVIKIERLGGEETRTHGPWAKGQSAYFVQYNSGKKSLCMDMRKDESKEILRKLVKISDVFLQNFRPGTIDKMGFGYDVLHELNPKIIMVNVSAYGQFGPYRDRIGYDPIGQGHVRHNDGHRRGGNAADTGGGPYHRPHDSSARSHLGPLRLCERGTSQGRVRPSTFAWPTPATATRRYPSPPTWEVGDYRSETRTGPRRPVGLTHVRMAGFSSRRGTSTSGLGCAGRLTSPNGWKMSVLPRGTGAHRMGSPSIRRSTSYWQTWASRKPLIILPCTT